MFWKLKVFFLKVKKPNEEIFKPFFIPKERPLHKIILEHSLQLIFLQPVYWLP